jgi:hypothetical protein
MPTKASATKTAPATVTVDFTERVPKKGSVRFNCTTPDAALTSIYLSNDADAALGNPAALTVTIAAA